MQTETCDDREKHNNDHDDTIVLTSDDAGNNDTSAAGNVVDLQPAELSLDRQLADMKDQWIRAVAEGENIRKRAQRDKDDALKYGAVNLARDVVSIADNLQRALHACEKEDRAMLPSNIQNLIVGIDMINKEVESAFERHRIKRIHPMFEKFDPNVHQAMCEIESVDHPAGTVISVMQTGYMLHDRLLRPAMVGVSKVAPTAEETAAVDKPETSTADHSMDTVNEVA